MTAEAQADEAQGGLAGRAFWTTLDQAVSSLASAALSIVLARAMSSTEFGTFALAFSLYSFLIGISQAVGGQVLTIRFTGVERGLRQRAVGRSTGIGFNLGVVAGLFLLVVVALVDLPAARVAVVVAVFLPVLLLQDAWRTALISAGTPRKALVNDLVWTALQLVAIGLLLVLDPSDATGFVLAWGASAGVAALLGIRQARQRPLLSVPGGVEWVGRHWDLSGYLLGQWVLVLGTTQIAFVLLATIGGVESVGSLRAGQTLLGPLNLFGMAVTAFVVPELVRLRPGRSGLVKAGVFFSLLVLAVDALWGGALLLLPDRVGVQLLGDTWANAREALPGMVVFTCAIGVTTGPALLFRALDRTRYFFWTGALLGPLILVFSVVGQAGFGVAGAAWGFALAAVVVAPVAFALTGHALRTSERLAHA